MPVILSDLSLTSLKLFLLCSEANQAMWLCLAGVGLEDWRMICGGRGDDVIEDDVRGGL